MFTIEENQITEMGRVSHQEMIPAQCQNGDFGRWWGDRSDSQDINRLFMDNDQLVSVSRYGIAFHDVAEGFSTIKQLSFNRDCGDRPVFEEEIDF